MSHADDIDKHYGVLIRCTTINHNVIDHLRAEEVVDRMQEAELKANRNSFMQCLLLFQWLQTASSQQFESFLEAMNVTEQEHVENLLRGRTEEDHLPLSDARHKRLEKIRPKMVKVMYTEVELIGLLRSSKAISWTDIDEITAEKVDHVKNSTLISAIMRRSNHSYDRFKEALMRTLQTVAAEYLSEGEMPAVHVNNNRPDLDEPLCIAINGVLANRNTEDASIRTLLVEMNGLGLNAVKAEPGQSIVIFVYCKTVQNAAEFINLFNSGRLQLILDGFLNKLLLTIEPQNTQTLCSSIRLEDQDVIALEEFIQSTGYLTESFKRPKPLDAKHGQTVTKQWDEKSAKRTIAELEHPTREAMKQRVQDNFTYFVTDIDCRTLSDCLIQHRVLTAERWEQIQSTEPTNRCKNRALMNWLLDTNHPAAFTVLREALESEHNWLLELIDQPKKSVPSNSEIRSRVQENYECLLSDMDPASVSDWLLTEGVVARDTLHQILREEPTLRDKNRALLECLLESTHSSAFTVLRKALEMENHWLLTVIDQPSMSSNEGFQTMACKDELLKEIKQLQEDNEKLRKNLEDAQEKLRQEKELTQGVKRKAWATALKQMQLAIELGISERRMARNNQMLKSLVGNLKRAGSLPEDSEYQDLSALRRFSTDSGLLSLASKPNVPTKQKPERDCSTPITIGRPQGLEVEPSDQISGTKVKNINEMILQGRKTTQTVSSKRKQKKPFIAKIPGSSYKAKLCELWIRPGFGYGFAFKTVKNGWQFYSHTVDIVELESPAESSGLRLGDRIVEANGVSVIKKPHEEAIKVMKTFPTRLTLLLAEEKGEKVLQESAADQWIGSINVASTDRSIPKTESKIYYKTAPVSLPIMRTNASKADDGHIICGITTLDNELYVVTTECAEVEIYDSVTCGFVRRWTLEELLAPSDISSCNRNKCLYIMNYEDERQINYILIVAPNGILINSFSTGDASAQSMSVTDESHIVVAIHDKDKLVEYSSNGQIIREIKLLQETGITHPLHAIKLSNNLYAASYGDEENGSIQSVCIVDTEGHSVNSFSAELNSTVGLESPVHILAVDGGRIMVADYGNGRVLLLDSNLVCERVLLDKKHGLRLPWRIHFNASKKRLFVSDSDYSFEKEHNVDSKLLAFEVR